MTDTAPVKITSTDLQRFKENFPGHYAFLCECIKTGDFVLLDDKERVGVSS